MARFGKDCIVLPDFRQFVGIAAGKPVCDQTLISAEAVSTLASIGFSFSR